MIRACIKSLVWDAEKHLHHFVADTDVKAKVASLTVSCAMGEFQFTGGGLQSGGSISGGRAFLAMRSMRGVFARHWDIVANSGNFSGTLALLWRDGASPFAEFLRFSDWLHATLRRTHQLALRKDGRYFAWRICTTAWQSLLN